MNSDITAIKVEDLSKTYKLYGGPIDRLKEAVHPLRKTYHTDFHALTDVNFEIKKGETVGIIGRNGSGKSTLLKIISGVLTPTKGGISTNGKISALLELGTGFNPELTGIENIFFNGTIMNYTKKQMEERLDDILSFADIGDFIYQPVKMYSSGMFTRLAFAVAINVNPDILIVDEALAVGDIHFQLRCYNKLREMRDSGMSILFVSHDTEIVKRICDRAMVIHDGKIVYSGIPDKVTAWYIALASADFELSRMKFKDTSLNADHNKEERSNIADKKQPIPISDIPAGGISPDAVRHGDGSAQVLAVWDENSITTNTAVVMWNDDFHCSIAVEFFKKQKFYIIGILIKDRYGTEIIALNTFQEQFDVPPAEAGDKIIFTFSFPIHLRPGDYSVSAAVGYDQYEMKWMDWVDNACIMRVTDSRSDRLIFGVVLPPGRHIAVNKVSQHQTN